MLVVIQSVGVSTIRRDTGRSELRRRPRGDPPAYTTILTLITFLTLAELSASSRSTESELQTHCNSLSYRNYHSTQSMSTQNFKVFAHFLYVLVCTMHHFTQTSI